MSFFSSPSLTSLLKLYELNKNKKDNNTNLDSTSENDISQTDAKSSLDTKVPTTKPTVPIPVVPDDSDYMMYLNFDSEVTALLRFWYSCFEIVAFLDFLSAIITNEFEPEILHHHTVQHHYHGTTKHGSVIINNESMEYFDWILVRLLYIFQNNTITEYIRATAMRWNILFSILWFIQAFVGAHRRRKKMLRLMKQKERQQRNDFIQQSIHSMNESDTVSTSSSSKGTSDENNRTTRRRMKQNSDNRDGQDAQKRKENRTVPRLMSSKERSYNTKKADYYYFSFVTGQLLLLPVGFYVYLYNFLFKLHNPNHTEQTIQIVHYSNIMSYFNITNYTTKKGQKLPDARREIYTIRTSISLIHAIVNNIGIAFSMRMRPVLEYMKEQGKHLIVKRARKIILDAVRHPIQYHAYYTRVLRFIRWMNYLLPVLGRTPMLKDNLVELYKKYQQRKQAAIAKKVRKQFKKQLSRDSLEDYSATFIQKTYRAYVQRKRMMAALMFYDKLQQNSAIKIQNAFRATLQRARARIELKKLQLHRLKERELQHRRSLGEDERYNIRVLEYDVKKYINNRLLLRPNTKLAIVWKFIVVIAMIFEIAALLILPPILERYKVRHPHRAARLLHESKITLGISHKDDSILNVESALYVLLSPTPVQHLPQCQMPLKQYVLDNISIKKPFRSIHFLTDLLIHQIKQKQPLPIDPMVPSSPTMPIPNVPWYCTSKWYRIAQSLYISWLQITISNLLPVIGLLCYIDIFVIFFTGTYDHTTGTLVPKPFVERWIAPGLVIQLITNPLMTNTFKTTILLSDKILFYGPSRTFRWTLALFYPVAKYVSRLIKFTWKKIVQEQNHSLLHTPPPVPVVVPETIKPDTKKTTTAAEELPRRHSMIRLSKYLRDRRNMGMSHISSHMDFNPLRLSCIRRARTTGNFLTMNRSPSLRYIHSNLRLQVPISYSTASFSRTTLSPSAAFVWTNSSTTTTQQSQQHHQYGFHTRTSSTAMFARVYDSQLDFFQSSTNDNNDLSNNSYSNTLDAGIGFPSAKSVTNFLSSSWRNSISDESNATMSDLYRRRSSVANLTSAGHWIEPISEQKSFNMSDDNIE